LAGALVILANAPALWEHAENMGVVVYNSDNYNIVLYASQGAIGAMLCAVVGFLIHTDTPGHRFSRVVALALAGSFAGDVVQAFMPSPAYTAKHEVTILILSVALAALYEVLRWNVTVRRRLAKMDPQTPSNPVKDAPHVEIAVDPALTTDQPPIAPQESPGAIPEPPEQRPKIGFLYGGGKRLT
jgi:hypothetical protein